MTLYSIFRVDRKKDAQFIMDCEYNDAYICKHIDLL